MQGQVYDVLPDNGCTGRQILDLYWQGEKEYIFDISIPYHMYCTGNAMCRSLVRKIET